MSDRELLREFREQGSETAFQLLAQRHIDLVYATAWRRVNDSGLAEEITQEVFIALARRAPFLRPEVNLAGWLYQATLLQARRRYRDEQRRRRRQELAVEMGATMKAEDSLLKSLAPVLDDALLALRDRDRQALLLRFFERKSFREIAGELGVGEDAAQKRVAKSLEKLAAWFRHRGYGVPAATAVAAMLHEAAKAAPQGLAAVVAQGAIPYATSASLSGLGLWLTKFMILTKTQTAIACLVLLGAPVLYQWHAIIQAHSDQQRRGNALVELRGSIGLEERSVALLERRLRSSARTASGMQARLDRLAAGELRPLENESTLYLWDEQSDYVRVPKSLAAHLTFGEFDLQPRRKAKPERVQRPALARDGTPSPALLNAMGLTAEEGRSVTAATTRVFSDYAAMAAQHGTWTNANYSMTGGVEYKTWLTSALPEPAEQLRVDYSNSLVQLIGEERTRAFWLQSQNVFRDVLNEFGQAPHAVTVARQRDGQVLLGEMYFRPDGSDRFNYAGGDIAIPEPLKPYFEAWKQAALTSTNAAQP